MKTLVSALALFVTTSAFAQQTPNEPSAVIPEVTEVDFEEVDVNASLTGPSMKLVTERAGARFTPMVALRAHFTPEMRATTRRL